MPDLDVATDLPALSGWMIGAPAAHPLLQVIEEVTKSGAADSAGLVILAAFDDIIAILETAAPDRLATERKDLRQARTFDDLFIVRAELVAAAKLARANIPFDFGVRGADV